MNEGRRLSDRKFIAWAISQNDEVQKSDHVEIGSLKEDISWQMNDKTMNDSSLNWLISKGRSRA